MNGRCREKGVVYRATVETDNSKETYVGLTDTEFKARLANHKQSFTKEKLKNTTELSKHVWSLKDSNVEYTIKWEIVGKAKK